MIDGVAAVATYLADFARIRGTGAARKETSYYGPLENLLNAVGQGLKPKVHCVGQLADRFGVGSPDFGLFAQNQVQRGEPCDGAMPERGVVEVKGPGDDTVATADAEQVTRYYGRFNLVLVTNYRAFVLVGPDYSGRASVLERFSLAPTEPAFWELARPSATRGEGARPGVSRVSDARLDHQDTDYRAQGPRLAARLLCPRRPGPGRGCGRPARRSPTVRDGAGAGAGHRVRGRKGEHFFRSTLVQTLFYGVFSAWVLWARRSARRQARPGFDWQKAVWYLHVPMLRRAVRAGRPADQALEPLGLVEVLDWAEAALNRVDRAAFFAEVRRSRGGPVSSTSRSWRPSIPTCARSSASGTRRPRSSATWSPASITVLRDELGVADGLADPQRLRPRSLLRHRRLLVEVLHRIDRTLRRAGRRRAHGPGTQAGGHERVFGFEILPAPFVVAHLQLGACSRAAGRRFAATTERAGVYLTNALTGWQPPQDRSSTAAVPEWRTERDAAERVKHDVPILVILGNPPYNAFAGTSPEEEEGLVEPYKAGLQGAGASASSTSTISMSASFGSPSAALRRLTGRGVVCLHL